MTDQTRLDLTKALVATGMILYIPANFLPVMNITITGDLESLTILGGVQELADSGLMPVAVFVLFASIVIPFLKLACMSWLLMMHGSRRHCAHRAKAFHILHQVGTWSMIDIFLLSVLAAVGQLGIMASVEPQPGIVFFAAVLLCTLFAADIYQPRMIWNPSPSA
jgi:paraquat-inducible protein A